MWLGLLLALPLTACGGSTPAGGSHHRLSGLALTEVVGGGFVPADAAFVEQLPDVAVFADGRIFTVNQASASLDSKSALVTLVQRALPASAVHRIVNLAQAAGVTRHPPDVGRPHVTDMATTTLTLIADGNTSTVDVYALGWTDGLAPDQMAARKRLQAFSDELARLGTGAGPGSRPRAYLPTSLSVFAESSSGAPAVSSATRRWPLRSLRVTGGGPFGCVPVVGAANVRQILRLAARATRNTIWISDGQRWHLIFRPDLPGTKPCS